MVRSKQFVLSQDNLTLSGIDERLGHGSASIVRDLEHQLYVLGVANDDVWNEAVERNKNKEIRANLQLHRI